MPLSIEQVIGAAEQHLQTARLGLDDLRNQQQRRRAGLMNAIVFGRSATFALQNLQNLDENFGDWYKEHQERMRADPLMKYFHDQRTLITHKAHVSGMVTADFIRIDGRTLSALPRPPGAKKVFMGDENGASGWEVDLPDGSIHKFYVDLPAHMGTISIVLDAPGYENAPAANLVAMYLDRVGAVVREAREKFGRRTK